MNTPQTSQPLPDFAGQSTQPPVRQPVQISLSFMLILMVIFSVISAGLFYASRVRAVQEEISILTGVEIGNGGDAEPNRNAHLFFIMFTFTSPLVLAAICWAAQALFERLDDRQPSEQIVDE